MEESKPTLEEWKALYGAALEFRKIEPWKWTRETDVFGLYNTQNGEIGYCCIMGELGEVLAMSVYLGTEGLDGYLKLQHGQIKPEDPDALYIQNCLMVSYENKSFIEKEDMRIIKKLGLLLKGRRAWPLFRSYKPGYFPWYLSRDEALYMTVALQQAKDVCLRLKENNRLVHPHPPKQNFYLTRVPEVKDGCIVWKDEWKEPAPIKKGDSLNEPVDEIRTQRIKNSINQVSAIWEIDFFFTPTPVMEKERPFFPQAIMIADHDSGFIHDMHLAQTSARWEEFIDKFLLCMEKTSVVPLEILVRKEEMAKLFKPYTTRLNIELSKVKKLQNIDNARKSMMKFLKGF